MVQATHGNLCLCTRPPSQHGLLLQAGSYSSLSSGSPPGALHRLLPLPATLPPQPFLPSTHTCSSCTHTCTHISYIHAPVHTLLLHTAPVHTHTPLTHTDTHTDTHTSYTHRHSHLLHTQTLTPTHMHTPTRALLPLWLSQHLARPSMQHLLPTPHSMGPFTEELWLF